MASSVKKITVSLIGGYIQVLVANAEKPNAPEIYSVDSIKSVIPVYNPGVKAKGTYPFADQKEIIINFSNESSTPSVKFDLETVTNQPGWSLDLAGLVQAVSDIGGWLTAAGGGGAGNATEATLLSIASAVGASGDEEITLVRDIGDSNIIIQQITTKDQGTGATTTVYKKADGSVHTVVGTLQYIDPDDAVVAVERTPSLTREIGIVVGGSIPAGARSVTFSNLGNKNITVLGEIVKPGEAPSWNADGQKDTLGAFTYSSADVQCEYIISTLV